MSGSEMTVQRLQCSHCGGELPVMGKYVTFQCATCFRRWVISDDGLVPLTVYRAAPPEEREGSIIYLPFWVSGIDVSALRSSISESIASLTEVSQKIVTTKIERDTTEPDFITELGMGLMGHDSRDARGPALVDSSNMAKKLPSRGELDHILGRMEAAGRGHVYIPGFWTRNTRAYLKIGKLMTRKQPRFQAKKFDDPKVQVMCGLGPRDALRLVDYVFFATLPDSIMTCASFMGGVSLEAANPALIEFPFLESSGSLESLVGGFHIQSQILSSI